MSRLAIIGSSDLGRLVAHHALACGHEVAGFLDNRRPAGEAVEGYGPVLGPADRIEDLHASGAFEALAMGVGYLQFDYRKAAFERFKGRIPFANVIHRSAVIDPSCVLGEGVVILAGCVLDAGVALADNVLLNTGVVVAHHSTIGRHSFVGPAAAIAGKVRIGESCFIGINATITDHLTLADGVRIGAGSVLVRDAPEPGWLLGSPATKRDISGGF